MIQADRYEKCCNTNNEPDTCKSQVIEDLVRDKLIGRLDIPDPSDIEERFYSSCKPKYPSMNSVDQDEKKNIYEREKCHVSSIGKG
jgi:hypothetical protein